MLAAARAVATVEEVVDDLGTEGSNAVVLPAWTVGAIVVAPGGARPSYAHGYYHRDNAFYTEWDGIAKDRDRFRKWIDDEVMGFAIERERGRDVYRDGDDDGCCRASARQR